MRNSLAVIDVDAVTCPLSALSHHIVLSVCHRLAADYYLVYCLHHSNTDMSQSSSSSSFQPLFNAALQDYAKKTGTKLDDHPLAKQLEHCDSVDSISSVLQEHAQRFHEFRGEDGKIMTSLKSTVHILYTLSTSAVLVEGIGIVCSKVALRQSLSLMCVP